MNNLTHFLNCIIMPVYTNTRGKKKRPQKMSENYKVKKHPFKELQTGYTLLYVYKLEAVKPKQRDKQGRKMN